MVEAPGVFTDWIKKIIWLLNYEIIIKLLAKLFFMNKSMFQGHYDGSFRETWHVRKKLRKKHYFRSDLH